MGNFSIRRTVTSVLFGLSLLGLQAGLPKSLLPSAQARDAAIAQALTSLESAANAQDLAGVMTFYGESFTHSDGLSRTMLADGLTELWAQYSGIQYEIEVEDWDTEGQTVIAHTITRVSGSRYEGTRPIRLQAEIESRQYFDRASEQILRQDILAERTLIFSGVNPPDVDINLPLEVETGETFDFDVIVQEPLQGELLLGGAIEAPASYEDVEDFETFELELLQAGGVFRRGTAPRQPDDQWLSAIVIREDGITMLTQRLRIR